MKRNHILIAAAIVLLAAAGFALIYLFVLGRGTGEEITYTHLDRVEISFDYEKISGFSTNQFAIWVEDMDGNFVNTVYATQWIATGGYEKRPNGIPLWVARSGLAGMSKSEVDAVAGATPRTGPQNFVWDLTDKAGNTVTPGEYRFFVEGTLRGSNRVLYAGVIDISGGEAAANAEAAFTYEGDGGSNNALTSDSPENKMIGPVAARFLLGQ